MSFYIYKKKIGDETFLLLQLDVYFVYVMDFCQKSAFPWINLK